MSDLLVRCDQFGPPEIYYKSDHRPTVMVDRKWLVHLLDHHLSDGPPYPWDKKPEVEPAKVESTPLEFPEVQTVDQAVTWLLGYPDAVRHLNGSDEADLIWFHHGLGRWIRNTLGLWCEGSPITGDRHPDDASQDIIERAWKRLKEPK